MIVAPSEPGTPQLSVQMGDIVTLRKPHACGTRDWEVTRIGADIGLRCTRCGHAMTVARHEFRARVVRISHRPGILPLQ